jgi:hypothetical protein
MASPPPRQVRRIGLSNPRAARGQATEAENRRVQAQNAVDQREAEERDHRRALRLVAPVVGLEIPMDEDDSGEDSDNQFALDSQSQSSIDDDQHSPPPPAVRPAVQPRNISPVPIQAIAAAPRNTRNRALWQGNHAKLNIVARRYLMQPGRQEMLAMASNDADRIAEIRQLKRDPTKDFGHDNFKHSALTFLVRKTREELNSDQTFVQNYLPQNSLLSDELLRQKINQFMLVAINTDVADIDSRNCLFCANSCKLIQSFQIQNSGSMISKK